MPNKPNLFQKFPLSKYQSIQQTNQNSYFFHTEILIQPKNLETLLKTLRPYCFIITDEDLNTTVFEIEREFYSPNSSQNQNHKQLKPNRIEIYKETILYQNNQISSLNINQIKFSKNKLLQLPCKQTLDQHQINLILQQYQGSTAYVYYSHNLNFYQITLYQPHTNTHIYFKINTFLTTNQQDISINPHSIQIQITSPSRTNSLKQLIKSTLQQESYIQSIKSIKI